MSNRSKVVNYIQKAITDAGGVIEGGSGSNDPKGAETRFVTINGESFTISVSPALIGAGAGAPPIGGITYYSKNQLR